MRKRRLVDTNLIVRHLVQDHEKHARAAGRLFEACDRGEIEIILLSAVVAECVFVLESFYHHPRAAISDSLAKLITSPGVEIRDAEAHVNALERYGKTRVHFVDCLIAAEAAAAGVSVATFDHDFRKFPDVRVENE
jgi:uncharacterized protein